MEAYDTSFAKSKVPFASFLATFRGRSFKPALVVLHKNFHMGLLGDDHIDHQTLKPGPKHCCRVPSFKAGGKKEFPGPEKMLRLGIA